MRVVVDLAIEMEQGCLPSGTTWRASLAPAVGGACPPEDCGGPGGFADLKDLLAGPPGPERDEMRTWAGEDYDPRIST